VFRRPPWGRQPYKVWWKKQGNNSKKYILCFLLCSNTLKKFCCIWFNRSKDIPCQRKPLEKTLLHVFSSFRVTCVHVHHVFLRRGGWPQTWLHWIYVPQEPLKQIQKVGFARVLGEKSRIFFGRQKIVPQLSRNDPARDSCNIEG